MNPGRPVFVIDTEEQSIEASVSALREIVEGRKPAHWSGVGSTQAQESGE